MIQTLDQRLRAVGRLGVETAAAFPSPGPGRMSAGSFASKILAETFRARVVVVGEEFPFRIRAPRGRRLPG
jgi:FAD synthase